MVSSYLCFCGTILRLKLTDLLGIPLGSSLQWSPTSTPSKNSIIVPQDVYLHTNTLAALANLAPHMFGLSSHAAQRLVSLFDMLSRRYQRLAHTDSVKAALQQPVAQLYAAEEHDVSELRVGL